MRSSFLEASPAQAPANSSRAPAAGDYTTESPPRATRLTPAHRPALNVVGLYCAPGLARAS
ncbi:MAG: hypothetical protein ACYSUI_12290, partial [Planctomycetota bacterium]